MMTTRNMLFALIAASATLTAQATVISIPDASASGGAFDTIPFGRTTGVPQNVRYQCLVSASDFANAAMEIHGVRFAAVLDHLIHFDRLIVRLGHTRVSTLGLTFDQNLDPATASTVLDLRDHYWRNDGAAWNDIGLQHPFSYNGTDNLCIEIVVIATALQVRLGSSSFLEGNRQRVFRRDYDGTQTTATDSDFRALKVQFYSDHATVQTFGYGCPGLGAVPEMSVVGSPIVGSTFSIDSNALLLPVAGALIVGFSNSSPVLPLATGGLPLSPPCSLYIAPDLALPAPAAQAGTVAFPLMTPPDPGFRAYFQYVWLNAHFPANSSPFIFSDYARIVTGY